MSKRKTINKETVNTYLSILRSYFWGTPIPKVIPSLEEVVVLAKEQTTRGVVFQAIINGQVDIDHDTYMRMRQSLLKIASLHYMDERAIKITVEALRKEGIEPILLKGEGNASFYPVPLARECGDVDLYTGKENYHKACDVINSLATEEEKSKAEQSDKHYEITLDGVPMEIHHSTMIFYDDEFDSLYQKYADKGTSENLDTIVISKIPVSLPSSTFNAFYIFVHAWHHFRNGGIGMRQVNDWMMFLHGNKDRIDKDELGEILRSLSLMNAWKAFGCIAVEMLGLPEDEMPFHDPSFLAKAEAVLEMIMEEGNFGHVITKSQRTSSNYYIKKIQSVLIYNRRDKRIGKIFPEETKSHMGQVMKRGFRKIWHDKIAEEDF
ncbi:MAG: nucleotidyltransferase family protein [Bacteroidales bacterium]|nr:nucleotidyltransferase family protein [Bacteroidales bacterium]